MSSGDIDYPSHSLSEFAVGQIQERIFTIDEKCLYDFTIASGDDHPLHTNANFALACGYQDVLVHGMCVTSRCSAFVAKEFVGSRGLLISMSADFLLPIFRNELLIWRTEVSRVDSVAEIVEIKWVILKEKNIVAQRGIACAWLGRN